MAEVDARVVALSVADEATTRTLVEKAGLEFPVGHSADVEAVVGLVRYVRQPSQGAMVWMAASNKWGE